MQPSPAKIAGMGVFTEIRWIVPRGRRVAMELTDEDIAVGFVDPESDAAA